MIIPVILCGGSGTRLWPLSRSGFPKQFLCLTGENSLFQQTVQRSLALAYQCPTVKKPLVVCSEEHRFLVLEQLREHEVVPSAILLEPIGRSTAPTLTLAALAALEDEDAVLVVMPSDHSVSDESAFLESVKTAIEVARTGAIAIFGAVAQYPETGYGYIKTEDPTHFEGKDNVVHTVKEFIEKPDKETAQSYIAQNNYYWNSGVFVLKASVWLKALGGFQADMIKNIQNVWEKRVNDTSSMIACPMTRFDKNLFANIQEKSIDYAVMDPLSLSTQSTRADLSLPDLKMIRLQTGWSDLGSWAGIWQNLQKDEANNGYCGDAISVDSNNTLIYATSRLVSVVGVKDLAVIETADAVLVTPRMGHVGIKHVIEKLIADKREEPILHRKVNRPWGWYDSIEEGKHFKVKRIHVNAGASLSLQKHQHRAEHWIVIQGTAEVTNGNNVLILNENQTTYIPMGEVHRLANPSTVPLEIIEVQLGHYLGEDDIIRLDDHYGRVQS